MNNSIKIIKPWEEYELLDCGEGEKIERWGKYLLIRPEPQAIWNKTDSKIWIDFDAKYNKFSSNSQWEFRKPIPSRWDINYKRYKFIVKPTNFKHTGIFPEQSINWEVILNLLSKQKQTKHLNNIKILNLFGYTGCLTTVLAKNNFHVTQVDSSRGMTQIAIENSYISNVDRNYTRFIVDDVFKFVKREIKRGSKYNAIIMDPPSYGRGPKGELWKIEKTLQVLLQNLKNIFYKPLFLLINTYSTDISNFSIATLASMIFKDVFDNIDIYETGIGFGKKDYILPLGRSCLFFNL